MLELITAVSLIQLIIKLISLIKTLDIIGDTRQY